jgi:hypothetical protein
MRKYYDIADNTGGPGDGTGTPAPAAPKGYTVTTPQQRTDWNSFLDYAKQKGADLTDAAAQKTLLAGYKKTNPSFSITADQIPSIQYEAYQLRKGDSFGKLGAKELGYLRQGMSPNYLNADTSNIGKLYYPQEGNFGTDLEGYYNAKFNPSAKVAPVQKPVLTAPAQANNLPVTGGLQGVYAQHDTALKRVNQLAAQPGNEFLHSRGDALINANYVPDTDQMSFRDASAKATKPLGLDPNMFWASSAEEGATGLIPDKQGNVNTDPNIDLNSKYPVSGFSNFGVDHFHDDFSELVRRGYLPKDFDYKKSVHTNERHEKVNSADFKTVQDALQAKAAYIRMHQDNLDQWTKDNNVQLTPAARQFFSYMSYNGGPGTAHKLINYYKNNGLLANDQFLKSKPPHELDQSDSYGKVLPRWQMAQLMKKEQLFDQ